jgi:hypothetical protein
MRTGVEMNTLYALLGWLVIFGGLYGALLVTP